MAYSKTDMVAALCLNILDSDTDFSTTSHPTADQVDVWLSSGCSIIETHLSSWGYSVPPGSSSGVWYMLADLNALFGAARAELSRVNVTVAPGERTRGQVYNDMFWKGLFELRLLDLTEMGLSRRSGDKIYVGGVSKDDKDTWVDDDDRVEPRLRRGMFKMPGSVYPDGSDDADD